MVNRVCITGGRGFLGQHVVEGLLGSGYRVVSLVRDLPGDRPPSFRSGLTEVFGDVRDSELLFRILVDYGCTHIVHLAAQAYVPNALRNPLDTFESNVRGTYALLDAARRYRDDIKGIVAFTSDKVYGSAPTPYKETTPLQGLYPYDASKVCADVLARSYAHTYSLPVVVARCANIYGPGDTHETRLIPGVIRSILNAERPFIRSDGSPVREYTYVSDAVRAILSLLDDASLFVGESFNFGGGETVSVLDLVNHILRIMHSGLVPDIHGTAKAELDVQSVDSSKARELLSWSPEVSLTKGLELTVRWWEQHLGPTFHEPEYLAQPT